MFHLEKLKDLTCAHEYAVTVSNWFEVLGPIEDLVDLWDKFKCKTLEAAKRYIGEYPRSLDDLALAETLDSIEKSHAARLAGNRDQYRTLSHRMRTLLRRQGEICQESCRGS